MRKVMRIFFWVVKGVMLVIALGAVVMWPVSSGRMMHVEAQRYSGIPQAIEFRQYWGGCCDGRLYAGRRYRDIFAEPALTAYRDELPDYRKGWKWERELGTQEWNERNWDSSWWVLRWRSWRDANAGYNYGHTSAAVPLWLVALVFGIWPVISLWLVMRRRSRRRQFFGRGLCEKCGYDLRATPRPVNEGGAVMGVCPECGWRVAETSTTHA